MMQYRVRDMTGQTFGRLTVKAFRGTNKRRCALWECSCSCGHIVVVSSESLRKGNTKSCGCLHKDYVLRYMYKHGETGLTKTPEYKAWSSIMERCTNPLHKSWVSYGGRGIRIAPAWRISYLDFLKAVGRRPGRGYSIERIDNDGDYTPENCRWATAKEQGNNRRTNRWLDFNGCRKTVAQWCEELGLVRSTVTSRLRAGWAVGDILTNKLPKYTRVQRRN